MAVTVDIADRLYDYTDEEAAAQAVEAFQTEAGLTDEVLIALWNDAKSPEREELDLRILAAIDTNGSAKRARDNVPSEIRACPFYTETYPEFLM